jgi:hypothetical protein
MIENQKIRTTPLGFMRSVLYRDPGLRGDSLRGLRFTLGWFKGIPLGLNVVRGLSLPRVAQRADVRLVLHPGLA